MRPYHFSLEVLVDHDSVEAAKQLVQRMVPESERVHLVKVKFIPTVVLMEGWGEYVVDEEAA